MKMKRLFTLVLSLMMILSLSAPASAIDGENKSAEKAMKQAAVQTRSGADDGLNYSDLDGWSVVSDSYEGSVKNGKEHTITGAGTVHEKMEAAKQRSLLENQNRHLWSENEELKEALEEERSFSDRLLEGIDRVLDMLERHLPKQLLHLVDKARELLPDHQTYSQEKPHERGHSWGDMSL